MIEGAVLHHQHNDMFKLIQAGWQSCEAPVQGTLLSVHTYPDSTLILGARGTVSLVLRFGVRTGTVVGEVRKFSIGSRGLSIGIFILLRKLNKDCGKFRNARCHNSRCAGSKCFPFVVPTFSFPRIRQLDKDFLSYRLA